MNPFLTEPTGRRLALVLIALLLGLLAAAPAADAHLKNPLHNWYFAGGTYGNSAGTGKRIDPINILFYRGGRITLNRVTQHVSHHTRVERREKNYRECTGSNQYVKSIHHAYRDRRPDAPRHSYRVQGLDLESGCSGERDHMRLWDDSAHEAYNDNHRSNDWVVANFHHDLDKDGKHDPASWEPNETRFVNRMDKTHCVRRNWRYHPGSFQKGNTWRGLSNNGRISLITLAHDGPGCARETG